MRTNKPARLVKSTKMAFDEAIEAGRLGTNIYGWEGDIPAPGYYQQGNTLIWIYETPIDGRIGEAL